MGHRSWRSRHPVCAPPRIRTITVRRLRTNDVHPMPKRHHRPQSHNQHRTRRRLRCSLGGEGYLPRHHHPQLECDDCRIKLARNHSSRNPSSRHGDQFLFDYPTCHSWAAERQTAARIRKPIQPHDAARKYKQPYRVDTISARKPIQPHDAVPQYQQSHRVDTISARKPIQPHTAGHLWQQPYRVDTDRTW